MGIYRQIQVPDVCGVEAASIRGPEKDISIRSGV